ncbi:MAG: hypothetical protein HQL13_06260, partial [Candidatus Omnitrophica bacterium]|nr:hypothetical protein [Candidatus Omnitrophota bacterium]
GTTMDDSATITGNTNLNIYSTNTGAVTLGSVNGLSTVTGNLSVTASGTITATSVTAGGSGNVYLTSTGGGHNIVVGLITALGGNINLNSAGTITDQDGPSATVDILGLGLFLTTSGDVGTTTNYLNTKVGTIDDYSGTQHIGGSLYINEYDGVNLGSVNGLSTTAGSNGSIFVKTNATADGALIATQVTAGGSGNIHLTSQLGNVPTGNNNDIQIGLVTAAGGNVYLNSNRNVTDLDAGVATVDVVALGLYLQANGSVGTLADSLYTQVNTIDDMIGGDTHVNVYINNTGAVNLGSINGLSTTTGDLSVTASGTITATSVTAGGTGNVYLTSTGAGHNIVVGSIIALGGNIYLNSAGTVTDQDGPSSTVDIRGLGLFLTAGGDVGTVTNYLNTRVATIDDYSSTKHVAGNVYINEYDGVNLGSVNGLSTTAASNGSIFIKSNAVGDGVLTATSVTAGGVGNVTLTSQTGAGGGNDISVGLVTAALNNVTLISDRNIIDLDGPLTTVDIVANNLYLQAKGSVGTSVNEINTQVNYIDNNSTAVGGNVNNNIYIDQTGGVTLGSINGLSTTAGVIDFDATGTIYTGTVSAGGGYGLFLTALNGSILGLPGGLLQATANSVLEASGVIGTISSPVNVDVNGILWVWSASSQNQVSVILNGTVNSGAFTPRVEIPQPTPPGLVLLNNHLMGGGNYGSGSMNNSILSRSYGEIILALDGMDAYDSFYNKVMHPWLYRFSQPWLVNNGAKLDANTLSDAPGTVDATALNIPNLVPNGLPQPNYYIIGAPQGQDR